MSVRDDGIGWSGQIRELDETYGEESLKLISSALLFGFCLSLGLIVLGVVGPERWWPVFETLLEPGSHILQTHTLLDAVAALLFNGLFYAVGFFVIGAVVKRAMGR
jgi:hypothetical protein